MFRLSTAKSDRLCSLTCVCSGILRLRNQNGVPNPIRNLLKHRTAGRTASRSRLRENDNYVLRIVVRIKSRKPGMDLLHAVLVIPSCLSGGCFRSRLSMRRTVLFAGSLLYRRKHKILKQGGMIRTQYAHRLLAASC